MIARDGRSGAVDRGQPRRLQNWPERRFDGWVVMASSSAAAYFSAWCPDSFNDDAFGGDRFRLSLASSHRTVWPRLAATATTSPAATTLAPASNTPSGLGAARSPLPTMVPRPTMSSRSSPSKPTSAVGCPWPAGDRQLRLLDRLDGAHRPHVQLWSPHPPSRWPDV